MDSGSAFGLTFDADHCITMASNSPSSRNASPKIIKGRSTPPDRHDHSGEFPNNCNKSRTPSPRTRVSRTKSSGSRGSRKSQIRGASPTGSTSSGSSIPRVSSRSASPAEDAALKVKFPYTSTPRQVLDYDGAVAGPSQIANLPSDRHKGRPHTLSQSQISVNSHHSQPSLDESSVSLSLASSGTHTTASQIESEPDTSEVSVPIVGYEIMEERARFTVFKIHVQVSSHDNWYIFRRYTDFIRLNDSLKDLFPHFRLALPPKKWFGDNFDRNFLEDRQLGLQAFLNNVTSHRDVRQSQPVREFFCFDEPPGPHDSLEESRAQCEMMEEQVYTLKRGIQERDARITLLEEEINLHKAEIDNLRKALRIERSLNNTRRASPSSRSESSLPEQDQASFTEADQQASDAKSSSSVVSRDASSVTSWDATSDPAHDLKLGKIRDSDFKSSSPSGTKTKSSGSVPRSRNQADRLQAGSRLSPSLSGSPNKKVTLSTTDSKPLQLNSPANSPVRKPVQKGKNTDKVAAENE